MSRACGPRLQGIALLLGALAIAAWPPLGAAQDPTAELTRALQGLGSSGFLWGRLAAEEESPDGPWTPLVGVEVRLYPYVPSLAADLDRIRDQARASGRSYDAAVKRLQDRLRTYETQVKAAGAPAVAGAPEGSPIRQRTTDASGVFAFEDVPSGDWLLVALQLSPYSQPSAPVRPTLGKGRGSGFLPSAPRPAKKAEIWVTRVHVEAGARARVLLTDRSRFMVGPVR